MNKKQEVTLPEAQEEAKEGVFKASIVVLLLIIGTLAIIICLGLYLYLHYFDTARDYYEKADNARRSFEGEVQKVEETGQNIKEKALQIKDYFTRH